MGEDPSAKCPRGETSDQNIEVDVVQDPGEKLDYTKRLNEVDIDDNEKLDVVCSSNPNEADEMIYRIRKRVGILYPRTKGLRPHPKEDNLYTFVSFSTEGDKQKLKEFGLEINPTRSVIHPFYKHMKKKIDKEEDHKLWGMSQLPDYLIEYAVIDPYATYESWNKIENIREGLECSKAKSDDKNIKI
ncbi:hypothetical protein D1007_00143 [Hordeum vulgare]|nr:hypothetical protein D1007_00143 [Hordeum vulgare]